MKASKEKKFISKGHNLLNFAFNCGVIIVKDKDKSQMTVSVRVQCEGSRAASRSTADSFIYVFLESVLSEHSNRKAS
jgi:hypothetical protein